MTTTEPLRIPAWDETNTTTGWAGSWDAMRRENLLTWEIAEEDAFGVGRNTESGGRLLAPVPGQKHLFRDDQPRFVQQEGEWVINPAAFLAAQPSTYQTINNQRFFEAMDYVLERAHGEFEVEKTMELHGGKMLVAAFKALQPLRISGDPSKTHEFVTFTIRHDGNGALRVIPMHMRLWCANQLNSAERSARREKVGFSVKHTLKWEQQLGKAATAWEVSHKDGLAWEKLANELLGRGVTPRQAGAFLRKVFPIDRSKMSDRRIEGQQRRRAAVKAILASPTCEGIEKTAYGLSQAVIEWADHVQPARSAETRTARGLLVSNEYKRRALRAARAMLS